MDRVLPRTFKVLYFLGFWSDKDEKGSVYRIAFKYVNIFIFSWFIFGSIYGIYRSSESSDDFVDMLFRSTDYLSFWVKTIYIIVQKNELVVLRRRLLSSLFFPKTVEEFIIEKKYKSLNEMMFNVLTIAFASAGFFLFTTPFMTQSLTLPQEMYQFCDVKKLPCFVVSYLMQLYCLVTGYSLAVAITTLNFGYAIILAGQFDLILHRLPNFSAREVVSYAFITETIRQANNFFAPILLLTFSASLLMLCTLIYTLSQVRNKNSIKIFFILTYVTFRPL